MWIVNRITCRRRFRIMVACYVDCESDNMPQTIPDYGGMLDTLKDLKMLSQNRCGNADRKEDSAKPNDCGGKMYPSDEQFDN